MTFAIMMTAIAFASAILFMTGITIIITGGNMYQVFVAIFFFFSRAAAVVIIVHATATSAGGGAIISTTVGC